LCNIIDLHFTVVITKSIKKHQNNKYIKW